MLSSLRFIGVTLRFDLLPIIKARWRGYGTKAYSHPRPKTLQKGWRRRRRCGKSEWEERKWRKAVLKLPVVENFVPFVFPSSLLRCCLTIIKTSLPPPVILFTPFSIICFIFSLAVTIVTVLIYVVFFFSK